MRALALALGIALVSIPAIAARGPSTKIAYVHGRQALVIYADSPLRQPIALPQTGPPRWSGDGRLLSFGGYIVSGGVRLPTGELSWAPTGERAAYVTKAGGVSVWSRSGTQQVVPDGWGAVGVAWSGGGALALGRARPSDTAVWAWRNGTLRKLLDTPDRGRPQPVGWHNGHVLWWDWPNSGSIAADGVAPYQDGRRIATTLMYSDYVDVCGGHLAVAAGGDRYAMHGKRILFDGHDVSRDPSRSWVSPSCTANGRLVAAASANAMPNRIGREHRAIWSLRPMRRQLTHPPTGWTDEYPHLLPDGSVVLVRTRQVPTTHAKLELLRGGKLTALQQLTFSTDSSGDFLNYYGHYDWPSRLAVAA
jgi:hypothetical protein